LPTDPSGRCNENISVEHHSSAIMELSSILISLVFMLGATAICVILFERLGFGSVLGFIVAGIIIGPHTPGLVASQNVNDLQNVAELGVVLFLFTVGLEMLPRKVWAMRRLLFGLGSAQMLATAAILGVYLVFLIKVHWQTAIILGFGFAMSSTAIIMTTLQERGALVSEHGRTSFAILMAQDLWVVPVMALVPILAHKTTQAAGIPIWQKALLVAGVLAGIFVVGRYLLPAVLGYTARQRRMDAFGILLFLAVIAASWAVDRVGISMTLGAFIMGMLLSASDYRYQIEAIVAPFKVTLMGLFFIAVGMSIDVGALLHDWSRLLVHVPVVLFLKVAILAALVLAFGISRSAAVRTGFYLSQVGEFAFVLFGAAAAAGLLSAEGHTLAMLVVAVSMILTPLVVKVGDRLAGRLRDVPPETGATPAADLERHVVVIGYDEVGQLICMLLKKAKIPHVAFDRDIDLVQRGKQSGYDVHFGDMYSTVTQQAAGLGKASAAFVSTRDSKRAEGLALTLHRLYPSLNVYVRVWSLGEQDKLVSKGIKKAATGYIESTLIRGALLLKDLGVSEVDVNELVKTFRNDNYALVRAEYSEQVKE
jgi:glutathione-regulated potassium-efflux system protein KefB